MTTRAVLGDAVIIGLDSESIHFSSRNINVLMAVMVMASVVLGKDFVDLATANAASLRERRQDEGDDQSNNFQHNRFLWSAS